MLDFANLLHSPSHGGVEIRIDIIDILDNPDLIPVSAEESQEFLRVHAAKDGSLTDLEAIQMKDWKNGSRLFRVEVFDRMPRTTSSQPCTYKKNRERT